MVVVLIGGVARVRSSYAIQRNAVVLSNHSTFIAAWIVAYKYNISREGKV